MKLLICRSTKHYQCLTIQITVFQVLNLINLLDKYNIISIKIHKCKNFIIMQIILISYLFLSYVSNLCLDVIVVLTTENYLIISNLCYCSKFSWQDFYYQMFLLLKTLKTKQK